MLCFLSVLWPRISHHLHFLPFLQRGLFLPLLPVFFLLLFFSCPREADLISLVYHGCSCWATSWAADYSGEQQSIDQATPLSRQFCPEWQLHVTEHEPGSNFECHYKWLKIWFHKSAGCVCSVYEHIGSHPPRNKEHHLFSLVEVYPQTHLH